MNSTKDLSAYIYNNSDGGITKDAIDEAIGIAIDSNPGDRYELLDFIEIAYDEARSVASTDPDIAVGVLTDVVLEFIRLLRPVSTPTMSPEAYYQPLALLLGCPRMVMRYCLGQDDKEVINTMACLRRMILVVGHLDDRSLKDWGDELIHMSPRGSTPPLPASERVSLDLGALRMFDGYVKAKKPSATNPGGIALMLTSTVDEMLRASEGATVELLEFFTKAAKTIETGIDTNLADLGYSFESAPDGIGKTLELVDDFVDSLDVVQ